MNTHFGENYALSDAFTFFAESASRGALFNGVERAVDSRFSDNGAMWAPSTMLGA